MGQPARLEKQYHNQTFIIVLGSYITRRSPCVNTLVNLAGKLDKFAGAQGQARKPNAGSNEAPTKALTPPEALSPPLILPLVKDFFTKFLKVFMKMTQA